MNDLLAYPGQQQHAHAWEALARDIAATGGQVSEVPASAGPVRQGELTIIGSGIESVGFILGDEELIRAADAVFYCVSDPATVVWLKTIRPDAYDLYVLYDNSKVRYTTYMQMAEAMLHFVRQGKKVIAVYYGHPGIFVLPTHRAILIARREGHKAQMRPSVCALDCLCADLGVDPSQPGMQTHEATGMLIRGRAPDTSLHVVLWQVGLIGEMGYRRKGYLNSNFSIFVEFLQLHYGADYPVTNYVASRYPTIPSTIETYPLSALHDPEIQKKVTGISTFYLPPKDTVAVDQAMLARLGLLKPGQAIRASSGPLREIGLYGVRERKAFKAFEQFHVPKDYFWQEDTAASRFIIAMRQDFSLRELYQHTPSSAVSEQVFPGLTKRERALLIKRDSGSIQIAAKGAGIAKAENQAFLSALFTQKPLLSKLLRLFRTTRLEDIPQVLPEWSARQGFPVEWARLRTDIDLATRNSLFPWAGAYQTEDGRLILLSGDGAKAKLSVDGRQVSPFTYRHGALQWKAEASGGEHGFLTADVDIQGRRRLVGSIWPDGDAAPTKHGLVALEGEPGRQHVSEAIGQYVKSGPAGSETLAITVADTPGRGRHVRADLNGAELDGPVRYAGRVLSVGGRDFASGKAGNGQDGWIRQDSLPQALAGIYATSTTGGGGLRSFSVGDEGIRVNGSVPKVIERQGGKIAWSGGPATCPSGNVTLLLDAVTLYPGLFGSVATGTGKLYKCFGRISPQQGLRRPEPEFGLTPRAWEQLVAVSAGGNAFFWHQWEKANLAAWLVNTTLTKLLP